MRKSNSKLMGSIWLLLFLLMLFPAFLLMHIDIRSENIDLTKGIYFDHKRKSEYARQLEERFKVDDKNLLLGQRLYKAYFLTEQFQKGFHLLNKLKKNALTKNNQSREFLVELDLARIKALAYSYQFKEAIQESRNFISQYQDDFKDLAKQIELEISRFNESGKLPHKSSGEKDSAWIFEERITSSLPLPYANVHISLPGDKIVLRKGKVFYQAKLPRQRKGNSFSKIRFHELEWTKDYQVRSKDLLPGFSEDSYISLEGSEIFFFNAQVEAVKKNNLEKRDKQKTAKEYLSKTLYHEVISTGLICADPYLEPENKYLFVSCKQNFQDAPMDLYFSFKWKNGKWSKLARLNISSSGDDINPAVSPDGRWLFFSSDGYPGYGGMDFFRVSLKYSLNENTDCKLPQVSGSVQNMGKRFNSFRDERGPLGFSRDGHYLIFYRETQIFGPGIYSAKLPLNYIFNTVKILKVFLKDSENHSLLKGQISLIPSQRKDLRGKRIFSIDEKGGFLFIDAGERYFLKANVPDYFYYFDQLLAGNKPYDNIYLELKKIKPGATLTAKGILFDYNQATLKEEAIEAIEAILDLLRFNPSIRIQLEGHTADIGRLQHKFMRDSVRLSEDRAIAVKNYLVMKKIFPGRIKIKGFGPTSPLPGYPRQSPENRRTEIRIIDTNWDPKREIMPNMAFVDFSAKMEKKNNPLNYLKISLPESIHTSLSNIGYLHKKFPRENWISDLDEIKNNKFNRFASRFGLDYIIFGEFQELSDMLIIYPKIYKAKNDKIIELNAFTTATGPDLFQDIDNLSRVIEKELDK